MLEVYSPHLGYFLGHFPGQILMIAALVLGGLNFTGKLDMWWLAMPASVAAYGANYVDDVCSQWGL